MPRRSVHLQRRRGYTGGQGFGGAGEQLRVQRGVLQEKAGDLDSDYRDKREHMEQDLVDVIVTVFEKSVPYSV